MKTLSKLLLAGMVASLAACQTQTGDPRQGGFWGWNEDLAKQRQTDLNKQATNSQNESNTEWNNNKKLLEQKQAQEQELQLLNARLAEIDAANVALEKQIAQLGQRSDEKKRDKVDFSKKLAGLKSRLADCKKAIQDNQAANAAPNKVRVSQMMDELAADQRKLQQAFLLSR